MAPTGSNITPTAAITLMPTELLRSMVNFTDEEAKAIVGRKRIGSARKLRRIASGATALPRLYGLVVDTVEHGDGPEPSR